MEETIGGKKTTQTNFYGELGRTDYQTKQYFIIIKYWLKIVNSAERKYGKYIYNTMLADLEENDRQINWALLVKRFLSNLGFY